MDILTRRLLQTVWEEGREIIGIIKYSQLVTEIFLPFLGLMRQEEKTMMNEKEREWRGPPLKGYDLQLTDEGSLW